MPSGEMERSDIAILNSSEIELLLMDLGDELRTLAKRTQHRNNTNHHHLLKQLEFYGDITHKLGVLTELVTHEIRHVAEQHTKHYKPKRRTFTRPIETTQIERDRP